MHLSEKQTIAIELIEDNQTKEIVYGGGAGSIGSPTGAGGAVRIIWGLGRAFPSTNTGDL